MKVKTILDEVEFELNLRGIKSENRLTHLRQMNFDLTELIGFEDWDWAMVHLDPIVSITESKSEYGLPDNFPENFVKISGPTGDEWACKINDGTSDAPVGYLSPPAFFSLDSTVTGKPSKYTVMSRSDSRRKIALHPIPDSSYTLSGIYVPTDWSLDEQASLPPIPGNCSILKYSILKRYDQTTYLPYYQQALTVVYMRGARQRKAQLTPYIQ